MEKYSWNWLDIEPYADSALCTGRAVVTGGQTFKRISVNLASNSAQDHTHPYDQLFCLLSGEAVITVSGVPFPMTGGAVVRIPANVKHSAYFGAACEVLEIGLGVDPA
jgi:quercetin dioxygenase-like cupin family protein